MTTAKEQYELLTDFQNFCKQYPAFTHDNLFRTWCMQQLVALGLRIETLEQENKELCRQLQAKKSRPRPPKT